MDKNVSLLWPDNKRPEQAEKLPSEFVCDLALDDLAYHIYYENNKYALKILSEMCCDSEIINYRLDILEDFMKIPALEEITLKSFHNLKRQELMSSNKILKTGSFIDIRAKVKSLEAYINCIKEFREFSRVYEEYLKSQGLKKLINYINGIHDSEDFKVLVDGVEKIRRLFTKKISSLTIGINLNDEMKPYEAGIIEIGSKPFARKSLLAEIMNYSSNKVMDDGVVVLHRLRGESEFATIDNMLYNDMTDLTEQVMKYFTAALKSYFLLHIDFLYDIELECKFYIGAARMFKNLMHHGINVCRPQISSSEERVFIVKGLSDIHLSLKTMEADWQTKAGNLIVPNDVLMPDDGRIFIVTGPNQGGKTTYARAIGVCQILAQAGLYVPAESALISLVDCIYTHFPKQEVIGISSGRLSEECAVLNKTFSNVTKYSLVILNETLSSTTPTEGLYIAKEVVSILRHIGCRAVYTTHFLDLALEVDNINNNIPGESLVSSIVAGMEKDNKRSYKLIPGKPLAGSYAQDIAEKHGITYCQYLENANT